MSITCNKDRADEYMHRIPEVYMTCVQKKAIVSPFWGGMRFPDITSKWHAPLHVFRASPAQSGEI